MLTATLIKSGLIGIMIERPESVTYGALIITDKDNIIKEINSCTLEETDKIYYAECPSFKSNCDCGLKRLHFSSPGSPDCIARGFVELALNADEIIKYSLDNLDSLKQMEDTNPKDFVIIKGLQHEDIVEATVAMSSNNPFSGVIDVIKDIIKGKDVNVDDVLSKMKPSPDTSNPNIN